jgi:biotin operon repressor
MSWQALKWAVAQTTGSPTKKAVLMVLAEAANGRTGACFPSIQEIADRAELGERAVWAALQELERDGTISRSRRTNRRGYRTSDLITLTLGQVAPRAVRRAVAQSQDVRLGHGEPTRTSDNPYSHVVHGLLAPGATQDEPGSEPEEEPGLFSQAPAPRRSRKKPATPLPIDCPNERDLLWARGQLDARAPHLAVEGQAERFRDHHLSRDSRFSDWSAAWRTWIHKAPEFSHARQTKAAPRSAVDWALGGDE